MRSFLIGASVLAAGLLAAQPSRAVTVTDPGARPDSAMTRVEGGCGGPQFYRAPNGYCYRKPGYYGRYAPPPPPSYARRICGPGWHPTPYGCRPNW